MPGGEDLGFQINLAGLLTAKRLTSGEFIFVSSGTRDSKLNTNVFQEIAAGLDNVACQLRADTARISFNVNHEENFCIFLTNMIYGA
jgi:hypothetical protein